MFSKDQFVQDCLSAADEGQAAIREIVTAAVAEPAAIVADLGEPTQAGIDTLYRGPKLTIINFTWAPHTFDGCAASASYAVPR